MRGLIADLLDAGHIEAGTLMRSCSADMVPHERGPEPQ